MEGCIISNIKTPFAMYNGNIIHISELKKEKNGHDYKCYCCSCNEKLIPRLGNKNTWHFSHKSENCNNALETGLHIMAKRILSERKEIKLPTLSVNKDEYLLERKDFIYSSSSKRIRTECMLIHNENFNHEYVDVDYEYEIVCRSKLYSFDSVNIEKRLNDIIADIILYKNGKPLLVEIAVTHFIDDEKRMKINDMKLSTIEIDLSQYNKNFLKMSMEEIERIIIEDTKNKKWIYNAKAENIISDLIKKNNLEKIRKDKLLKNEKEILLSKKEFLYKKEAILKNKYKKDKEQSQLWKYLVKKLWIDENNIPSIINVDIDDKLIFACDKNIWQASIFNSFISNKKNRYLSARSISRWIIYSSNIPLNKELLKSNNLFTYTDQSKLENVVNKYLGFLCSNGIIYFDFRAYRVKIDSFRAAANIIEKILTK